MISQVRASKPPRIGGPYPMFPVNPAAFRPGATCSHSIPAWSQGVCMICHHTGSRLESILWSERAQSVNPEVDSAAKIKARAKLQALHRKNKKKVRAA